MSTPVQRELTSAVMAASPLGIQGLISHCIFVLEGSCCQHGWAESPAQVECSFKDLLRSCITTVDDKPRVCRVALNLSLSHESVLLADPGSLFHTDGLSLADRAGLRPFCVSSLPRTDACSPWGFSLGCVRLCVPGFPGPLQAVRRQ